MKKHPLDKFSKFLETYGAKSEHPIKDWDESFYHLRKVIEQSKEKESNIYRRTFMDGYQGIWIALSSRKLLERLNNCKKEKEVFYGAFQKRNKQNCQMVGC